MGKNISSLLSVLKRRRWSALATFASVIGTSILYLSFTPPVYQVTGRLMLDDKKVNISELGRDLSRISATTPGGPSPLANQAELIRSQRILKRTVDKVISQGADSPQGKLAIKQLKKGLKVKIVPATNILELSYQDRAPVLATKLLNVISQSMVEESTESLRLEVKAAREFLEREVPKKRVKAEAAEAEENRYRQASGIISFEDQARSLVEGLATLDNQERTLSAQLQEVKARVKELQRITNNTTPQNAYTAGRIGQDQELKDLRTKLAELEAKLVQGRSRFTDASPVIVSLLQQRDELRVLYNEKVSRLLSENQTVLPANIASDELSQNLTSQYIASETERIALAKKLSALQADRTELQKRLTQLPLQQQPLTALVRQREEATTSLKLLQSKLAETQIAEAQLVGNVRIIEQAQVPSEATGINKKAVLVIAMAFGTILAIGMTLLLEVMDNRLHNASEVEDLVKLPILGVLPNIAKAALSFDKLEQFLDNSELVEPYRQILKRLEFRSREKLRLIAVSSSVSGEGKSLVILHLATVATLLSRKTLIIDADLRHPSQHSLLNLPKEPGLTDVVDKKIALFHAVQSTGIENLSILTCGELCDRPASLLESAAMKLLLEEAATHYDLVIVDTSPVNNCADANTLSRYGDGLVMIVRPNFTLKEMLLRAVSELTGNGIPILGVVVNEMTTQTEKYSRYRVKGNKPISNPQNHSTPMGNPVNNSARR
jgi:capsular exopolysaccharide synthesis family protein